jgi:hypothetical protein
VAIPFDLFEAVGPSQIAELRDAFDPFSLLFDFELCTARIGEDKSYAPLATNFLKALFDDDELLRHRCQVFTACSILATVNLRRIFTEPVVPLYWFRLAALTHAGLLTEALYASMPIVPFPLRWLRTNLSQIDVTENSTDDLNALVRMLVIEAQAELIELDRRIASCDRRIRELYRSSELCQKLREIEGVGPVTATALVAAVGGSELLQEWPSVRCMAGAGAEAAVEWRTKPIVRHQQTRRPLLTHVDDPRRSRSSWQSWGQARSAKPLPC